MELLWLKLHWTGGALHRHENTQPEWVNQCSERTHRTLRDNTQSLNTWAIRELAPAMLEILICLMTREVGCMLFIFLSLIWDVNCWQEICVQYSETTNLGTLFLSRFRSLWAVLLWEWKPCDHTDYITVLYRSVWCYHNLVNIHYVSWHPAHVNFVHPTSNLCNFCIDG